MFQMATEPNTVSSWITMKYRAEMSFCVQDKDGIMAVEVPRLVSTHFTLASDWLGIVGLATIVEPGCYAFTKLGIKHKDSISVLLTILVLCEKIFTLRKY